MVLRATVPEAAIYKYGDFLAWEHDVSATPDAFYRRSVHEVSQAAAV
jgi:hypothetical protein